MCIVDSEALASVDFACKSTGSSETEIIDYDLKLPAVYSNENNVKLITMMNGEKLSLFFQTDETLSKKSIQNGKLFNNYDSNVKLPLDGKTVVGWREKLLYLEDGQVESFTPVMCPYSRNG